MRVEGRGCFHFKIHSNPTHILLGQDDAIRYIVIAIAAKKEKQADPECNIHGSDDAHITTMLLPLSRCGHMRSLL